MARYAENTKVDIGASCSEIERTLQRYGAPGDGFGYLRKGDKVLIQFEFRGKHYRLVLPLPDPKDEQFWFTPSLGKKRSPEAAQAEWEQACKQAWRALALVIKGNLEAIEAGIATFEDQFMAYRVLPGGATVGETIGSQLDAMTPGDLSALLALSARNEGSK